MTTAEQLNTALAGRGGHALVAYFGIALAVTHAGGPYCRGPLVGPG